VRKLPVLLAGSLRTPLLATETPKGGITVSAQGEERRKKGKDFSKSHWQ
jgi:hypothetical protein